MHTSREDFDAYSSSNFKLLTSLRQYGRPLWKAIRPIHFAANCASEKIVCSFDGSLDRGIRSVYVNVKLRRFAQPCVDSGICSRIYALAPTFGVLCRFTTRIETNERTRRATTEHRVEKGVLPSIKGSRFDSAIHGGVSTKNQKKSLAPTRLSFNRRENQPRVERKRKGFEEAEGGR